MLVADRILYHRRFGRSRLGTIVYIPGQSEINEDYGDDQWAFKLDEGTMYVTGYSPPQLPHASKRIQLIYRAGKEAEDVIKSYRIPPEEGRPETRRDFLAFIGIGTIIALVIVFCVAIWKWLF